MSAPYGVQLRRVKGWRKPDNTVVVRRPCKYGNPFDWQIYGKAEAVRLHREWLSSDPEGRAIAEAAQHELPGKNLACTCSLDEPCHRNTLLEIANGKATR